MFGDGLYLMLVTVNTPPTGAMLDVAANEGYFDPVRADVGDKIHHLRGKEHRKHQGYWHQS
jgi:hypothetical protein